MTRLAALPSSLLAPSLLALIAVVMLGGCSFDDLVQGGSDRPSPERCGECHVEVYAEWRASAHARAFAGESFAAVTADQSFESCLPCHAPDSVFAERGLRARSVQRAHGVDCISCHLHEGVLVGPFSTSGLVDPHPIRQEEPLYRRSDLCGVCHEHTFQEWSEAPQTARGAGPKQTCQECHMPPVERTLTQATGTASALVVALEADLPQRQHRFDLGGVQDLHEATTLTVQDVPGGFVLQVENHLPHSLPTGQFGPRTVEARIDFVGTGGRALARRVLVWSVRHGTAVPALGLDRREVEAPPGAVAARVELVRPRRPGSVELALGEAAWRAR